MAGNGMTDERLLGDLRERSDGGFDGWCWAPGQPEARQVVDLLVDDTLAASMVAAIFRRDLAALGYGDGRHGFAMRLPQHLSGRGGEQLITARERRSGRVFGRLLRQSPGGEPRGGAAVARLDGEMEAAWLRLEQVRAARQPGWSPAASLRGAFGALAGRMALRAGPAGLATARRLSAPAARLPALAAPRLSLLLPPDDAAATRVRALALAPALEAVAGELLAIPPEGDAATALLSGELVHLRCLRAAPGEDRVALAAAQGRGAHMLVLARRPAAPSAAGLLALAAALARAPHALWVGAELRHALAAQGCPVEVAARLPGRLGARLCLPRDLLAELGPPEAALSDGAGLEWADLAFKAWMLGVPLRGLAEPAPADPAAEPPATLPPATVRRAHARFAARWGAASTMLDRTAGAA